MTVTNCINSCRADMRSSQVKEGKWESHTPIRKSQKMVFTDCGRAYLAGYVVRDRH